MANTFIQIGDVLEFTAPTGGVTVGIPVEIGQLLVVPLVSVAATVKFNGQTRGVFNVTKAASQAWTEGQLVYWDAGNARFTSVATGSLLAGVAVEAEASGAGLTTGKVRLNGMARADEA